MYLLRIFHLVSPVFHYDIKMDDWLTISNLADELKADLPIGKWDIELYGVEETWSAIAINTPPVVEKESSPMAEFPHSDEDDEDDWENEIDMEDN